MRIRQILISLLGGAVVIVGAFWGLGHWTPMPTKTQTKSSLTVPTVAKAALPAGFSELRRFSFGAYQFVVLRHDHTAQRLIVLDNAAPLSPESDALFNQPLQPFFIQMLMPVFQSQTSFRNQSVQIRQVTLRDSKTQQTPQAVFHTKRYRVETILANKNTTFGVSVAQEVHQNKVTRWLFAFSRNPNQVDQVLSDYRTPKKPHS